jgi:hypothetical protein
MTLLVYSENCKYCTDIITFIRSQAVLLSIVRFHNINKQGVPSGLTRVPALISDDGATIIGADVRNYLESLLPSTIESSSMGSKLHSYNLDGTIETSIFSINSFGNSLAPPMTKDLEEKINKNVQDAYQNIKK